MTASELLAAHRDELNARFARGAGDLEPAAMLAYMRRTVVPILEAWRAGEPPASVLFALFDLGLVGLRVGVFELERVLRAAMPDLQLHVERAPAAVLRALGNGYLTIVRELGAEAASAWLAAIADGAGRCGDRAALLELGCVLAWRAGLAEARDTALECATKLDPALHHALFGAAAIDGDPERRFCKPGSTAALGPVALVGRAGGFVGFGGPFRLPPRPVVVADRMVCTDGSNTFELFADVFGMRFRPAPWAHGEAIAAPHADRATISGMTAVTLADSHVVLVHGRREAAVG